MDHPKGYLSEIKIKSKIKKNSIYGVFHYKKSDLQIKNIFTFKDNIQKKYRLLNHGFFLKPIKFSLKKTMIIERLSFLYNSLNSRNLTLLDILFILKNILYFPLAAYMKFNKKATFSRLGLYIVSEQSPNPKSKVSLSKIKDKWGYPIAKVNWLLKKSDLKNIYKSYEFLKKALIKENPSFKNEFAKNHNFLDIFLESAAHHSGTARMSNCQENGVVDKNCKVFNIDNLFICDASIFTRSGNANPVLNIAIFSIRLSYFLINFIKK